MTFLPIVSRELRVASRRASTYWTRLLSTLSAIVVSSFTWMILMRASPRETGFYLFMWLAIIAYGYSLLIGFLLTADSLSEEKREGTLGLLFLTDLRGYDIVFGKLFATSIAAVYGLIAIIPVLGIALLMGGVAVIEFARVVLVCGNLLFLSLTVGMLASSICRDERRAIGLAFLILLLLSAAMPALSAWVTYKFKLEHPPVWLLVPTPGYAAFLAFDEASNQMTRQKYNYFYQSVISLHALGWIALLLACSIVPRSWRDKAGTAAQQSRQSAWRRFAFGAADVRRAVRRHMLSINPIYWLTARDRFKVPAVWACLFVVAGLWLIGLFRSPEDWLNEGAYITTALVLHLLFKAWIAMEASQRFNLDRQSGALELVLSTPLSVREILGGQWRALLRQFGLAVLLVAAVDLLFLGASMKRYPAEEDLILLWLAGVTVFLVDCLALAWLGMWRGLTSRKASQASTGALVRICVLPWLIFLGAIAIIAMLDVLRLANTMSFGTGFFILLWWGISLAVALPFGLGAYRRLHREFRVVATQRFESGAHRLGRWIGSLLARAGR